jgi:hypothetical protein
MTDQYKLQLCQIVRNVMKMHGKKMVFLNKYESGTRTVKCYSCGCDANLEQHLRALLSTFPSVKSEIYRTRGSFYGNMGFIVKFPAA